MMNKLFAIQLVIMMVLSSIGVRIVHHDCMFCSSYRIELASTKEYACPQKSCCSSETAVRHPEHQQSGCCKEELVKIKTALLSVDDNGIRKPVCRDQETGFSPAFTTNIWSVPVTPRSDIHPPPLPELSLPDAFVLTGNFRC